MKSKFDWIHEQKGTDDMKQQLYTSTKLHENVQKVSIAWEALRGSLADRKSVV